MKYPVKYDHWGYQFGDKVNFYTIHSGLDFNYGSAHEDLGLPVYAITDGEVVFSTRSGGWGNIIVIQHHELKRWTRYAHLQNRNVVEKQIVKEGDLIGTLGSTGNSTKPHLHFDVIKKKLVSWTKYTRLWTREKVEEYYDNPQSYLSDHKATQVSSLVKEPDWLSTPGIGVNKPSHFHKPAWDWGMKNKVTGGNNPKEFATREEVMTIIFRNNNLK